MNTSHTYPEHISIVRSPSWIGAARAAGLNQHDLLLASWVAGMAVGIGDVGLTLIRILNGRGPTRRDAQHITQLLLRHNLLALNVDTDTGRATIHLTIPDQHAAAA